jgi:hypothetical protein
MPFAYYRRLSAARRRIYRRSDSIVHVPVPDAAALRPFIPAISRALAEEATGDVQAACQRLADALLGQLGVPLVQIIVLSVRPRDSTGELHGIYEPGEPPYRSRITLWMKTAQRQKTVAFRTFLRTLLHEILHHLDYELFELPETLHTEGFYKRESSLFRQLNPDPSER